MISTKFAKRAKALLLTRATAVAALATALAIPAIILPTSPASAATRAGIVSIARAEIGTSEPSGCDKYGIDCSTTAWCAAFTQWVWRRAGVSPVPTTLVARNVGKWGVDNGLFKPRSDNGGNPQPGDIVVYGAPANQVGGHVGIVETVYSNGNITTIEGNFNNSVTRRSNLNPATATGNGKHISGYVRPPKTSDALRDVTGDGKSDLLAVDSSGNRMYRYAGSGTGGFGTAAQLGPGWGATRLITMADFTGDGIADMLAIRTDGSLYRYTGTGNGSFASAVRIWEGGWGVFRLVTSADFTGDGRADLLAVHSDGSLYRYNGNANGTVSRVGVVGSGWNAMRLITAADVNGDGRADILAVHNNGSLYYYKGNGNGTVQAGTVIGNGWASFRAVTAADYTSDGRADLLAVHSDGSLYRYNGNANGTLGRGVVVGSGWNTMRLINN
ncbi:FG-GAP-like repeat-containing protein [Polymorphospora sp. NPDC051019]|uniref:FG-GAP-like repeat-containing protein n=1 Tax=Polymorphospora sp. NPDC051019 TaxID=3155725 RepID=UPI00342BE45E